MNSYPLLEEYEEYAELELMTYGRQQRREQKRQKSTEQRRREIVQAAVDEDDSVASFVPTYVAPLDPRHYERQWILDALGPFYQENVITDVTRLVKGGKEANVYVCEAHPATGVPLIAAKLYRPRILRQLKNDALYKEGRLLRDADGKELRKDRETRAMRKKTRFGKALDSMAWVGHEFQTLRLLHGAGVDAPKPVAQGNNCILMEFVGDDLTTAPTLSEVGLSPAEARPLFDQILHNVELMLHHHQVHADLSAYNILYWRGRGVIIDFPQTVDARNNSHAPDLLARDVQRVGQQFQRWGVVNDPALIAQDLWDRYLTARL
jgi:RIO kinase 1